MLPLLFQPGKGQVVKTGVSQRHQAVKDHNGAIFTSCLHFSLYSQLSPSLSIYHSVHLPLLPSNDAPALSSRSVDALTLIFMINWGDLLTLPLTSPLVFTRAFHSPSSRLTLPFPLSSSFHQMLAPVAHLHSLNQLPSTRPCDPISSPHTCLLSPLLCKPSHLPKIPSDHRACTNL